MGLSSEHPQVMALMRAAQALADAKAEPVQDKVREALATVGIDIPGEDGPISYELLEWWHKHADTAARKTIPKAIEYGSTDLEWMGAVLLGAVDSDANHPGVQVEMGCAVYALGKLLRVIAALCDGETPSVDSWFDLEVYSVMAQHAREFGRWPGEGMI